MRKLCTKVKGLLFLLDEFRADRFDQNEALPASEVFKEIDATFTRPGAALQGARLKENLNQTTLASKLGISQSDLSKMEHGKRPIGKGMAKRLARILKVDHRIFL